jgi:ABC-type bacteriocin/lantibiotic exporter with double-glycine peptidase domain
LSDIVIAGAYVVSVALYLRIMAEYLVDYVAPGSSTATSVVAAAAMAIIVLVGVTCGRSRHWRSPRPSLPRVRDRRRCELGKR